jgi:aldose 1-epimerase
MINTDVTIRGGGYIAALRSDLGGNCYRLYHEPTRAEILRSPENEERRVKEQFLFGNPILFPPNRISGGSFDFCGKRYELPINEPSTGCHLHGALYKTEFKVTALTESSVTFEYTAGEGEYISFPHAFSIKRIYSLDEGGLSETVEVTNLSDTIMPFMLAYHTTFNAPFIEGSEVEDCYLMTGVVREHLRNEKYIPTLEYASGRERDEAIASGAYSVASGALSAFYSNNTRRSVVTDKRAGVSIVYEASEEYGYRMLWAKEDGRFIVVEPQTCAIDCFHLDAPAEEFGLISVLPGKTKVLNTVIRIDK